MVTPTIGLENRRPIDLRLLYPALTLSKRIWNAWTAGFISDQQHPLWRLDRANFATSWDSGEEQVYGDGLMNDHTFVVIPSVVSRHSWNLIFDADRARGKYTLIKQERVALDPRLAK